MFCNLAELREKKRCSILFFFPALIRMCITMRRLLCASMKAPTPLRHLHCSKCCGDKYSIVKPGKVSQYQSMPDYVMRPSYATTFLFGPAPIIQPDKPEIKTQTQIQGMRDACSLAREILSKACESAKPGTTTDELDILVQSECIKNKAYPSPLLYKGFPKSVCTSVNNVACHGIPDDRPLEDGDIVNVDVTVSTTVMSHDVSLGLWNH